MNSSDKHLSIPHYIVGDVTLTTVRKISAGSHSAVLSDLGELFVFGRTGFGCFKLPTRLADCGEVEEVSIGGQFGLARTKRQGIISWGRNSAGQRGNGDCNAIEGISRVTALDEKMITHVESGHNFVLCLGAVREKKVIDQSRSYSVYKVTTN